MRATLTGVFFTTLMSSAARLPLAWPTDKESNTTCASALPPTASWSYRTTGTFAAAAAARLPADRLESAEASRITLAPWEMASSTRRCWREGSPWAFSTPHLAFRALAFMASTKKGASRLSKRIVVEFGSRKNTLSLGCAEPAGDTIRGANGRGEIFAFILVSVNVQYGSGRQDHDFSSCSRHALWSWFSGLNLDRAAGGHGFDGGLCEAQRLAAVPGVGGQGCAVRQCFQEGIQFVAVGVGVALQEEIQQRRTRFGFHRIEAAHGGRAQVVVLQHAGRSQDLEAVVVAVAGLTAAVDVALLARGGLHDDHQRVVVVELFHQGLVDHAAGLGIDLDRLFAQQETGHVEIVDRHVAEDAARMLHVITRWQARVAAGNDPLTHLADVARVDGAAQLDVAGVEAAVEGHHDLGLELVQLFDGFVGLGQVVVHRLFAQHRLACARRFQHQLGVRVRRGADHHRVDIVTGDGGVGAVGVFAFQFLRQGLASGWKRIGNHNQLREGVGGDVGCVNLANAASTKNCDSNHDGVPVNNQLKARSTSARAVSNEVLAITSSACLRNFSLMISTP